MSDKPSDVKIRKFNSEYELYFSIIFSSVYRKTGNYHESEDICQEIFLSLFDNIESVSNTRAWLYGVMRNMISDYYRRKGKTQDEIELMVEESSAVYVNGFRDTRIIIEDILNSGDTFTDERERAVFDLVAVKGFSVAEASKHLSITYRQGRYGFERASAGIADALKKERNNFNRGAAMKTGEAILKLINKYDFKQEIPAEIRERMLFTKKKIHKDIMKKRCGDGAYETGGDGMKKYRGLIASAAAVVVIAAGVLFITMGGYLGQKSSDRTLSAQALFIKGDVSVERDGKSMQLKPGELIMKGDRVVTGKDSLAVLQVNETGVIKINAGTDCVFNEIFTGGDTEINLTGGSVYSNLKKLGKDQHYRIKTPTCTASVRGTEFLAVAGEKEDGVRVLEGVVNVSSKSSSTDVTELRGVNINTDGVLSEYSLNEIEILKLKKESLFQYVENLDKLDPQSLDVMMKDINDKIIPIETEIATLEVKPDDAEKLSPLDRLRKLNKPLTMIYMRDGSQIAGSVAGQKNGKMKLDTGEGIIEIPVDDIVKRMPLK